jgi:hypothetical protein
MEEDEPRFYATTTPLYIKDFGHPQILVSTEVLKPILCGY